MGIWLARSVTNRITAVQSYQLRNVISIALTWTVVDAALKILVSGRGVPVAGGHRLVTPEAIGIRMGIVFLVSFFMACVLVFRLRSAYRGYPLWKNWLYKGSWLMIGAFIMNFLVFVTYNYFILFTPFQKTLVLFFRESVYTRWLLVKMIQWMATFMVTQLAIEINSKYGPGVFRGMMLGKYVKPRKEKRIVIFIDLKDSTPIAERLGSQHYFDFIRNFIAHISSALTEYDANIYQYVGDEVVASWKSSPKNARRCLSALIDAQRAIQKASDDYRRKFGFVPEFRAGIHEGEVTVGEIGVVKKDLAMSGDTMNTTARIRTSCSVLHQKYIISQSFRNLLPLEDWQLKPLGSIELKGKAEGVPLYGLML
jgi:adenylate cyclase